MLNKILSIFIAVFLAGGFLLNSEKAYGDSYYRTAFGEEAAAIADEIEDRQAKAIILEAIGRGASVTFTYDGNNIVTAYRGVIPQRKIPGEKKYWRNMTEGEKKAALILLKTPGNKPYVTAAINVGGISHKLNESMWYDKGIIVYGNSFGGSSDRGPRYFGYDLNGGYYANDSFPRDSDSGRQPWEKNWWTITEIKQSAEAKNLIGNHALADAFDYSDKLRTAKDFLKANPSWRSHGMDEAYILSHFFFNSVLNDSGLTGGQFIGVQKNAGKLWYQTFSISGTVQMFSIAPEEVIEGEIIEWNNPEPEREPDPDPAIPAEEEETEVDGIPILSLPSFTYEGHPVCARDNSIYTVNGEIWSAYRTMKEGLASNRFTLADSGAGRISQITSSEAVATFDKEGVYDVRLRIAPKGKGYLYDNKAIEVGKTPAIQHSLTGTKKTNRKQILNFSVATHPASPIKEMWVEIEDITTGDKVRLYHDPVQPQNNELKNNEMIKTRAIQLLRSDEYFTDCKIEFLTKNQNWESFRYTAYIKDSRGKTEQISGEFTVAPDLPPLAAMDLEKIIVREEGCNTAIVEPEDVSVSDGDQMERKWFLYSPPSGTTPEEIKEEDKVFVPLEDIPGFQDISMEEGRLQRVRFGKEGVGAFSIKLDVKDLWTEETLEEYVSEEDYLKDSIIADSQVINIAPTVSVKPIKSQKAEILMLAAGDEDYKVLRETASALKPLLLENAIDGKITIKKMAPEISEIGIGQNQEPLTVATIEEPFGYEGGWSFLGGGCYGVDENNIYTVQATWRKTGINNYPESPYIITAYDGSTGDSLWTFNITESIMAVDDGGGWHEDDSRFAIDDEGEYVFFRNGKGKTLLLSADTGAYRTVLNFEVGQYNCSEKDAIYSFKDDGIYRISTKGQGIRKIFSGKISGDYARKQNGKVHFLLQSGGNIYRGLLDPITEKIETEQLKGESIDEQGSSYSLLGIGMDKTMFVHKYVDNGEDISAVMQIFDANNALIRSVNAEGKGSANCMANMWKPVYDEEGQCNYVVYTREEHKSGNAYYSNYVDLYHVADESGTRDLAYAFHNENGYATNSQIIFARQFGDKVYICTGAIWTYVYGFGYGGYTERANTFTFNTSDGTVDRQPRGIGFGIDGEYGRTSANYAAIHTDDNSTAQINGSKTVILKWKQNADQILSRYINKYCSGEGDKRYVIICDKEGKLDGEMPLAELALRKGKAQKVLMTDTDTDIAEVIVGQQFSENVLAIKTKDSEKEGCLSLDMSLDPGRTYFYEYEWKRQKDEESGRMIDSMAEPIIGSVLDDDLHGGKKLYVTEVIHEDFEDDDINPFFHVTPEKVKYGRYWAGNPGSIGSPSNYTRTDMDTVSFTIPDGRKAILSFDYDIRYYGGGSEWTDNYVALNGSSWDMFQSVGNRKGNYTFKTLLKEGENKLDFRCAYYGKKEGAPYFIIDNLTVSFLEGKDEEAGDPYENLKEGENGRKGQPVHGSAGGGWMKAEGSFSAPAGAYAYESMPAAFFQGTAHQAIAAGYLQKEGTKSPYEYTVHIPEGMVGARIGLKTISGSTASNYEPYFTWENYKWMNYNKTTGTRGHGNDIQSPFDIWLPKNRTGSQKIIATTPKYTSADIREVQMLFVDETNLILDSDRYFIDNQGDSYMESRRYTGKTKFTVVLPAENNLIYIKNLRFYTWNNGVKTYVKKEDFSEEADLAPWEMQNVTAAVTPILPDDPGEGQGMVYRKGELIAYDIKYYDYEKDPSKKSYWKYIHTPYNDGPNPDASIILDENGQVLAMNGTILDKPINRFEIDGKYTVEHWQEDNTNRSGLGFHQYDKLSNVETLTFYIEGAASAPYITYIKTRPVAIKEGSPYTILVGVDDNEKDTLRLDTEIYLGNRRIQADIKKGIKAEGGVYPQLEILPSASACIGNYDIICTVRDETGVGLDSLRFTVISEGKITGMVNHTAEWDKNRKKYNMRQFGEEVNREVVFNTYRNEDPPRRRGTNVFWSGERFELFAAVGGNPIAVKCNETEQGYSAVLSSTGKRNEKGERIFTGSLWDSSMINKWGRKAPEQLTLRFTAVYPGGVETDDVNIIIDSKEDYWILHRLW